MWPVGVAYSSAAKPIQQQKLQLDYYTHILRLYIMYKVWPINSGTESITRI
jgi:hypothetical protein